MSLGDTELVQFHLAYNMHVHDHWHMIYNYEQAYLCILFA